MIKMQKFSFSGFGKPVYAKLQINFTSELFLKSIKKNILLCKLSCWLIIYNLYDGQCGSKNKKQNLTEKPVFKNFAPRLDFKI